MSLSLAVPLLVLGGALDRILADLGGIDDNLSVGLGRLYGVTGAVVAGRGGRAAPVSDVFEQFVVQRSAALLRTAWMLTGDEAAAQDLVQAALLKTWSRWDRLVHREAAEAYVRRVLLSIFLTWRRRRWTAEVPAAVPGADLPVGGDESEVADVRAVVRASLARLPRRQRAVVVLRFFDDMSEASAAQLLGCSVGTIKSQTARALARLRADAQMSHLWDGGDGDEL